MATIELIDGNTLKRVRTMLKKGQTGEFRDTACPGLFIRVNQKKATWLIAARDLKLKLGNLDLFGSDDIQGLRELVERMRQLKKEGREPKDMLAEFLRDRDVAMASARTNVAHGLDDDWESVRDRFLAWVKAHRSKDTHRGYRSALGAVPGGAMEPDFQTVHRKPVKTVTTSDLVRVRDSIVERGAGGNFRQADLTVAALKSMFGWALNKSIVDQNPAAQLSKVLERPEQNLDFDPEKERVFTQLEIGMVMWALEYETNPTARLCASLQLATGQRRMTSCEARKSQFVEHPEYGMVWRLSKDKANAWRVLPLPDLARLTVETARGLARPDNPFLFPQQRPRKTGAPMDGHISERVISGVLEKMRQPGGVLHGVQFDPSTHDLRRTFTTVMGPRMHEFKIGGRSLEPDDVEMITHANEGRDSTASLVYDKSEYLDIKHRILEEWQTWVMEGYEQAKKVMEAKLKAA